jgi:O-acetylserine/cysteine efflux transporter
MKLSKFDLAQGILVTMIWGSNFSVIEMGLKDLDPFLLTALRFTFSAIPLVFLIRRPRDVSLKIIAAYGVLFGVGLWWLVNVAMHIGTSPGLASLILQFSAFFTIILSAIVFRERIAKAQQLGIGISFAGLLLIIYLTDESSSLAGIALILLAALSWSLCNLIVKRNKPANMLAFIVWSSLFSAPPLYLMTYIAEGSQPFYGLVENISVSSLFSIAFQSYITTIFGYMVWNNLMKKYEAAEVAPLSLIVPLSGLLTSYLLFDEDLGYDQFAAIALVMLGIAVFLNAGKMTNPRKQAQLQSGRG